MKKDYLIKVVESKDKENCLVYLIRVFEDGELIGEREFDNIGDCLLDIYKVERDIYDNKEVKSIEVDCKIKLNLE